MNFQTYLIQFSLNLAILESILTRDDVDDCGPPISDPMVYVEPSSKSRPTTEEFSRELAGRIAGEGSYGGAGNELKWVSAAIVHLGVPVAGPEVDGSGGATARGGGDATAPTATAARPRFTQTGARTSTREAQGVLPEVPELAKTPEVSQRRRWAAAGAK